jgi:mannose-6-phosphate isomerase-like protein (cupin superfamily)
MKLGYNSIRQIKKSLGGLGMKQAMDEEKELALAEKLFGKKARKSLKDKVLQTLANLQTEAQADLDNLPKLNRYSELSLWQNLVKDIAPPADFENIYTHILKKTPESVFCVVWVKNSVPEEEHHHLQENFLILEGTCDFITDNQTFRFGEGDFVAVPDKPHEVVVTSTKPLKFVIQRTKISA